MKNNTDYFSWLKNFSIAVFAIVSCLLIAEIGVRCFAPQATYRGGFSWRDEHVYDLKKNFRGEFSHPDYTYRVSTDARRMRKSFSSGRSGDLKIFFLGDSYTFGIGVRNGATFPSNTARYLTENKHPATAINGGVAGYCLSQSLCKYRHSRGQVKADIVVVAACFNDSISDFVNCDEFYSDCWFDRNGLTGTVHGVHNSLWTRAYPFVRDALLTNSQLAIFVITRTNQFLVVSGLRDGYKTAVTSFYAEEIYRQRKVDAQHTGEVLKELYADIKADGREAVFVYVPAWIEVNDNLWAVCVKSTSMQLTRNYPRHFLIDAARKAGFTHIVDPLASPDGVRALQTGFFPIDTHLNYAGNACLGRKISAAILDMVKSR